jgi:hypothetical protein
MVRTNLLRRLERFACGSSSRTSGTETLARLHITKHHPRSESGEDSRIFAITESPAEVFPSQFIAISILHYFASFRAAEGSAAGIRAQLCMLLTEEHDFSGRQAVRSNAGGVDRGQSDRAATFKV